MLTGMPIRVVEYDADWPAEFVVAAEELTAALGTAPWCTSVTRREM
jgi:GrpB-like predicted nucleotidyltransferase (UPF0157 family)